MTSLSETESDASELSFKLVFVGDSKVGKTSLIWRFDSDIIFKDYVPSYSINVTRHKRLNNIFIMLEYCDIPGTVDHT